MHENNDRDNSVVLKFDEHRCLFDESVCFESGTCKTAGQVNVWQQ